MGKRIEIKKIDLKMSLTDNQFLYRKYRKNKLNHFEASEKVKEISRKMYALSKKLNENKRLSPKTIKERFQREFEKICNEQ